MEKSEKRNFKLFVGRNSQGGDDLKIVQLFDALDKMDSYDEDLLLRKNPLLKKQQLSNLKSRLARQIINSLRLMETESDISIKLHEYMDAARILYNRGLYIHSLKLLAKTKQVAVEYKQESYRYLVNLYEKKIEALHITRSRYNRAQMLSEESEKSLKRMDLENNLSSLSLELYSWYIHHGIACNQQDVTAVETFFQQRLPQKRPSRASFYERLYFCESYSWYAFILQDLLLYYRYTKRWVDLYAEFPQMIACEPGQYIRGLHNLLQAHFNLSNYEKFRESLKLFQDFSDSEAGNQNFNIRVQTFVYLSLAKINLHFLQGTFTDGLSLIPSIEEKLRQYHRHLDAHRILGFYYKFACMYFGNGDCEIAIDYLNQIINYRMDIKTDLQCYARLLNLIVHFELGNYDLLEYLIKSAYRFMAKMENLSTVEEEIFRFLRKSFSLSSHQLIPAFRELKTKLEVLKGNPLATRSFMYLDVISWLESRIQGVPIQQVRRQLFLNRKHGRI